MSTPRKGAKVKLQKFKVGQRVRFRYVLERVSGVIIEDRGPLGVGGVQLYTVRAKLGRSVPIEIVLELPADKLRAA